MFFSYHRFLADTTWRAEKDLTVDIDSSDLQLHASNADTFAPFRISYTTLKKKLKKQTLKTASLIPNSLTT